ncbi:hypothetical protein C922_02693 [Plasmodium inui San Antonio 1]|uniref:Uncharacterized protein n=1 Tax=Plasmodium inui San Antonio 1 TaxID=1237626 RepID=W7ADI5_9APIC|nr:hypothetical protein C922_02693 [Plasmodium inui San Antonio 1]EUD67109.1 hypothetical protein C922_02693 [Plasmodium inui San Antonio 1]
MKKVESSTCESLENPTEQESHSYDANRTNNFLEKEGRSKIPHDEDGVNAGRNDTSRHKSEGGETTSSNNPDSNNGPKDSTSADVEDKIIRKYLSKRMSDIGLNPMRGSEGGGESAEEREKQKGDGHGNRSRGRSLGESLDEGGERQSPKRPFESLREHVTIMSDRSSEGDDVPLLKTLNIDHTKVRVKMGDTTGTSGGDAVAKIGGAILKQRQTHEGAEKVKNIKRSRINGDMKSSNKNKDADPESDASSDDEYLINLIRSNAGSDEFQSSKSQQTSKKDAARRLNEKVTRKTRISDGEGEGSDSSADDDSTSSCDSEEPILVKSKLKNQTNSPQRALGSSTNSHGGLVQTISSTGDSGRAQNNGVHNNETKQLIGKGKGSANVVIVKSSTTTKKKNAPSKEKVSSNVHASSKTHTSSKTHAAPNGKGSALKKKKSKKDKGKKKKKSTKAAKKTGTKEGRQKGVVAKRIKKGNKRSDRAKRRDHVTRKYKQKLKRRHSSDDLENSLSQSNDIETDSIVIGTFDPHNRTPKEKLVAQLLIRWWYVLPNWPTPDFNYEPELTKRKLRLVPLEEYEDEEDINKEGFRKVYEISAFPGVFRDATGKAYDLRDKESCPCYNNFIKKTELELLELICQAIKNQMESLKKSVYNESGTERTLERQLKEAEVKLNRITKKKATKTKSGEELEEVPEETLEETSEVGGGT